MHIPIITKRIHDFNDLRFNYHSRVDIAIHNRDKIEESLVLHRAQAAGRSMAHRKQIVQLRDWVDWETPRALETQRVKTPKFMRRKVLDLEVLSKPQLELLDILDHSILPFNSRGESRNEIYARLEKGKQDKAFRARLK